MIYKHVTFVVRSFILRVKIIEYSYIYIYIRVFMYIYYQHKCNKYLCSRLFKTRRLNIHTFFLNRKIT